MITVGWERIQALLTREWLPGEHVTVIGRTGSGKTHLALALADLRPQVLLLAVKRSDPLVSELAGKGWKVTGDLGDAVRTHEGRPVHPRLVYWPPQARAEFHDAQARNAALAPPMRRALAFAQNTRNWTLVVDETMHLADKLRLVHDLDELWFQGRTQKVSVVALAQRPARIPRLAISQASYLFIGIAQDKDDRDRLRDVPAAIPRELIEEGIAGLDTERHEFLFIDTKRGGLARTIAPA